MALTKCKECSNEVSDDARVCPHCGKRLAMQLWKKLLIGFFAIGFIGAAVSPKSPEKSSEEKAKPEVKKPTLRDFSTGCEVWWEKYNKHQLKDPDSLSWDSKHAELGTLKNKTTVVTVPYRAKNSFGALTLSQAVCSVDIETGKILEVIN